MKTEQVQAESMSIDQLKVLFYDQLKRFEQSKVNIERLDQLIAKKEAESVEVEAISEEVVE